MRRRRWLLTAMLAAGLGLPAMVVLPSILRERFLAHARSIPVGASRQEVEGLLGTPTERYARGAQFADALARATILLRLFIPESPETWAYGTFFAFRFLGPEEADILVEFDEDGFVQRVVIPDCMD